MDDLMGCCGRICETCDDVGNCPIHLTYVLLEDEKERSDEAWAVCDGERSDLKDENRKLRKALAIFAVGTTALDKIHPHVMGKMDSYLRQGFYHLQASSIRTQTFGDSVRARQVLGGKKVEWPCRSCWGTGKDDYSEKDEPCSVCKGDGKDKG